MPTIIAETSTHEIELTDNNEAIISVTWNGGCTYAIATVRPDLTISGKKEDLIIVAADILDCDVAEAEEILRDVSIEEILIQHVRNAKETYKINQEG